MWWSDHVREQLVGLLDLEGARFEYGSLLGHPPRLEPDGTVTVGRSRWDVELSGLPAEEVELRTFGNGQYYGRFMLKAKPGSKPSLQARLVAVTLADQAGRAFSASQAARSVVLTNQPGTQTAGLLRVARRLDRAAAFSVWKESVRRAPRRCAVIISLGAAPCRDQSRDRASANRSPEPLINGLVFTLKGVTLGR